MRDVDDILRITDRGLYCEAGGFFIDPWLPVEKALVTHAHSDHARWGCQSYLTAERGGRVLRERVGQDSVIETIPYGASIVINGVKVSFHPAGHILGSGQIRVEHRGQVWVVSGDYKTGGDDVTCEAFEPIKCHTFITESTFGLPIYRWQSEENIRREIREWRDDNISKNRVSVIFAYALGKAQRVLAGLNDDVPIFVHGAVKRFTEIYRQEGIALPLLTEVTPESVKAGKGKAMIIAPPSAMGTPWLRKFGPASLAFASGWMMIRGARRRRALDRGFVLSDHADWVGLLSAIKETRAERVGVTHGYSSQLARYLSESGLAEGFVIPTRFTGETEEAEEKMESSSDGVHQ